ncbi:MAG: RHS repeat domain-containing protein, partial [Bacteriovorax sp.]|nr:RHS repeat domain-containing protein [Bacteriovorax sp.]
MTKAFIKRLFFVLLSFFSSNLFAACDAYYVGRLHDLLSACATSNTYYQRVCDPNNPHFYYGSFEMSYTFNDVNTTLVACNGYICGSNRVVGGNLGMLRLPNECINPDDSNIPPTPQPKTVAIRNTDSRTRCGSIIQTSNMAVGETISLTGVPFYLTHISNNTLGKKAEYKSLIALSSSIIPNRLLSFTVIISDTQNNIILSAPVSATINQTYTYQWDGLENGVETWGAVKRNVLIKSASNAAPIDDQNFSFVIGGLKSKKLGLGGWLPSNWHFYDSASSKLFDGDGSSRNVVAASEGIYNRVASSNGSEVYYFDSIGRLVFTKTGLTGALIYSFNYDPTTEKLLSITDAFNKVTTFQYDSSNNLAQIISAQNIHTYFTVDTNGYLKTVTNPKNETYSMMYKDAGGLLASFTKPNGINSVFNYDSDGNLYTDINSGGQSTTLTKGPNIVNAISTLGKITQNRFDSATNTEIEIRPSGLATTYVHAPTLESTTSSVSTTKSNLV